MISPELVILAFCGGVFGTAIGALPAFSFTGFAVIAGEIIKIVQRAGGEAPTVDITSSIAFGPVLGPHVSFGGGAAALAYAVKKGYVDGAGFDYHPAKKITEGLGTKPDVLAVGGVFGVVGYLVAAVSSGIGAPWDPVAMGVFVSALVHRAVFGYSIIGISDVSLSKILDMTPGEKVEADGGIERTKPEVWLPYQSSWGSVTVLGIAVGVLGGFVAFRTGSAFLAFGISAATLVFINAGVERIPVTHHITLPASTVIVVLMNAETVTATVTTVIVTGAVMGAVGALAGELLQRVFYAHAETHLDPPAASILVTSFLVGIGSVIGVLPGSAWIPV
ncbi:MAG: hypothetical protein SXQ77_10615 [Halobacteria archaeon]|nr:hypothetical protein [Halobacteria archaeon]